MGICPNTSEATFLEEVGSFLQTTRSTEMERILAFELGFFFIRFHFQVVRQCWWKLYNPYVENSASLGLSLDRYSDWLNARFFFIFFFFYNRLNWQYLNVRKAGFECVIKFLSLCCTYNQKRILAYQNSEDMVFNRQFWHFYYNWSKIMLLIISLMCY